MKNTFTMLELLVLVCVLQMFAALPAAAGYFRMLDVAHPQVNAGFSIHGSETKPTTMLAIITHSPKDGFLLVPGVCWTPLAVGGGFKGGAFHLSAGPSLNLLPAVQGILSAFVNGVTDPDKYLNLKSILKKGTTESGDIVGALGINAEYDFTAKTFTAPLFAGVSWKF